MRADFELNAAEQAVESDLLRYYAAGEPMPAFVARLEQQLAAHTSAAPASRPTPGLLGRWLAAPRSMRWAGAALALLLILAVTVAALGPQRVWAEVQRLLGYVPGVGFVDLAETRVLVAPVETTRDGITVRVEQVIAEKDKTHVVVRSEGLPPEDALLPAGAAVPDTASDAFVLRLPDGRTFTTTEYSLRWGAGRSQDIASASCLSRPPFLALRPHLLLDAAAERVLGLLQIEPALQVQPHLGRRAEKAREAQRRVRGDRPLALHDLVDAARIDAQA